MALPFTGYAADPGNPALTQFTRPDGSTVPLFGVAADDYRRRIDALKALGPQPTAQAAPAMSVDPGMSSASDVPPETPGASGSWDQGPSETPAQPAPAMTAAPPREPAASANPNAGTGGDWEGSYGVIRPTPVSSTPVSEQPPRQLIPNEPPQGPAQSGQRFYSVDPSGRKILDTATGQVITRGSGGMGAQQRDAYEGQFDERYDQIDRQASEQAYLTRQGYRLALDQARAEEAFTRARQQDAQVNAAIQANKEQELASKAAELATQEERARNAYRSGTIDRDRYFSGPKGGANRARAFLAIAFGALAQFGAGMAGRASSNPGLDMVNGRIDDDVADQERELLMKKEDADNYLARSMRLEGSLQSARLATKAALLEAYQTEALALRNQTRQPQLKLELDKRMVELDAAKQAALTQLAGLRAQTLRAGMGSATTTRPATAAELQSVLGLDKTRGDIAQTSASTEKTGVETVGAARELQQPGGGKKLSEAERRYSQVTDAIWGDLNDVVQRYGGQIDPATGEIVGELDLPTDYPGGDTSETGELKSRMVKLGTSYANQINAGAEAGQPTKEALTPNLNRVPGYDTAEGQLRAMAREVWRSKQGLGTLPSSGATRR